MVGHHLNPFRSGVARFNEILAERLDVPLAGLHELSDDAPAHPLLSLKFGELDADGQTLLARLFERAPAWSLFLHDFARLPLELQGIEGAARVWCGNHQIQAELAELTDAAEVAWAPGLVSDLRAFEPASISVFSFGMAHKIRVDDFRRLRGLLDASNRSYVLYVSSANHETASIRDAQLVYEEMHAIFPAGLYFLGNLSDVAVHNYLLTTTFFAAFFPGGVRANNTSVASAMEHGAVVITNLDEHSPPELVHLENVVDVNQADALPTDPLELRRIAVAAMETGRARSWDALVARLRSSGPGSLG